MPPPGRVRNPVVTIVADYRRLPQGERRWHAAFAARPDMGLPDDKDELE
jgi:hypothetical protein